MQEHNFEPKQLIQSTKSTLSVILERLFTIGCLRVLRRNSVFWDVTPCNLVDLYWRFRGTFWLHLHSSTILCTSLQTVILHLITTCNFYKSSFIFGEIYCQNHNIREPNLFLLRNSYRLLTKKEIHSNLGPCINHVLKSMIGKLRSTWKWGLRFSRP
jgi:hypothetical protein